MASKWLSSFWASSDDRSKPMPTDASNLHDAAEQKSTLTSAEQALPPASTLSSAAQQSEPQPRKDRARLLFTAGTAFTVMSLIVTRRSFARRRLASNPSFQTSSQNHAKGQAAQVSPPTEAIEALNIATVNVLSVTMMSFGGALWYLGINSLDDARRLIRGGMGVDGTGRSEKDAEEDFEEWMASTLARKDAKEKARGVKDN